MHRGMHNFYCSICGACRPGVARGAAGGSVPRRPARQKRWVLHGLDAAKDVGCGINWVYMDVCLRRST